MSKLTTTLADTHTISLAAMEEASREGLRTADIEHMLLAFVLDAGIAGQVLRSVPITLDSARAAVSDLHTEQLRSLGIHPPTQAAGEIVFHETGGYEWSERALEVMKRSGAKGLNGDAPAMLLALLDEPSGLIRSVLLKFDTSPEAVSAKLDEAIKIPTHTPNIQNSRGPSGSASHFIAAPADRVWAVLADPLNMPKWDTSTAEIERGTSANTQPRSNESAPTIGDTWIARARTELPGGKRIRVKPAFITREVELTELSEPHLIEWKFTFPDAPKANIRRIRVEIEPAAGGTQLRTTLSWEPRSARKRAPGLRLLLRPLVRFSIWLQLSHLGDGIGRIFR